jgi:hypothetical protein
MRVKHKRGEAIEKKRSLFRNKINRLYGAEIKKGLTRTQFTFLRLLLRRKHGEE